MYKLLGYINSCQIIFYIAISIICLIVLVFVIRIKFINIVKKTSLRYKDILKLNEKYNFHKLREVYIIEKQQKSKAQFDRFNYTKFLEEKIEEEMDFYKSLIGASEDNTVWMQQYRMQLESITSFISRDTFKEKNIPYFIYKRIEKKIIADVILQPIVKPNVICKNKYTSPQGRNSYYDERTFYYDELVERYIIVREKIEKRATKEYQRKIMTDSLRYDILKRDGFKCVLCGRSAKNGVELHVDHIIPVSKGGRTIPENLRTLCDTCNLGKSDKYDEFGKN